MVHQTRVTIGTLHAVIEVEIRVITVDGTVDQGEMTRAMVEGTIMMAVVRMISVQIDPTEMGEMTMAIEVAEMIVRMTKMAITQGDVPTVRAATILPDAVIRHSETLPHQEERAQGTM